MKVYPSIGTFTHVSTPVQSDCKLIKSLGKYSGFAGQRHEVWETDTDFAVHLMGKDTTTKTVFVFEGGEL